MPVSCTDLAPIMHCADERALGWCQLLVVAAAEAEGVLVGLGLAVKPADRVLAGVGELLLGRGAQQLEEGHLDDMDGVLLFVDVGELDGGDRNVINPMRWKMSLLWRQAHSSVSIQSRQIQ